MVLIEENITKAATMLENLLMNCVENETVVCIHGNIREFIVRYSSAIDEFYIDNEKLCLVCGWFEMDINKNIIEINYSEEDKSVHIVFSDGELYLDFDEVDNFEINFE